MKYVKGKAMVLYWSWEPDMNSPRFRGMLSLPGMVVYNLIHFPQRVRWSRMGQIVR